MTNRFFTTTGCLLAIAACLFSGAAVQSAVIYKWRDAQGRIHFEYHPSVEGAEKIIIDNNAQQDGAYRGQMDKQIKMLQIYQEERQENNQLRKKKRQDRELRRKNCDRATRYLDNVRIASYLYEKTDDPRNPRILTNAERAAETARAEANVSRWCGQGS